tara:strand:- start:10335 stop:10631 length:297 start_codon:yes stop_codon:yes gene_type:complete
MSDYVKDYTQVGKQPKGQASDVVQLRAELNLWKQRAATYKGQARMWKRRALKAEEEVQKMGEAISSFQHGLLGVFDAHHEKMPGVFEPGTPEDLGRGC